ncbi:antibiotic biosynthesis monooxygenase [Halobacterium zhouii]|uniref:antibiotic biosynthesis monooxygenase n=1 Tax=Halobacterium zhouii TaxID=2902624 RepID=UPI001E5FC08A|nr:antibiotic biosynthesis monooxygenase [Halobacterium zhouii]
MGKTHVADFDAWRENFDQNDSLRTEHGQRGYQIFRSSDDPEDVVVLFEWDDRENARKLFESDEMRGRLADAGVEGQPELSYFEQVS